ncbi:hypothetical protein ETH_00036245, partial [Eimeria tenella]
YCLSTVDLPALASPLCSYCFLLLSESFEPRLLAMLSKWKETQRAFAAAATAAAAPSAAAPCAAAPSGAAPATAAPTAAAPAAAAPAAAAPARFTPADFVFGVTWAAEEKTLEASASHEEAPQGLEPFKLQAKALGALGVGPPGAPLPCGWRRVTSGPEVKSNFASTLLSKEARGQIRPEDLLLLLRPDGHIASFWS